MRLHHGAAGDTGDAIHAVAELPPGFAAVGAGGLLQVLEDFHRANDRSMRVADGNRPDAHRNFMSRFVVEKSCVQDGMRRFHRPRDWTILLAEFASRLVAVQQCFPNTRVPDHFMPCMPADALRAIAPQDDVLLQVNDTQSRRQAFENAAIDFRVVEREHAMAPKNNLRYVAYRRNLRILQPCHCRARPRFSPNRRRLLKIRMWHFRARSSPEVP